MRKLSILFLIFFGFDCLAQESWTVIQPKTEATPRHENSFVACDGKLYSLGGRGQRPVEEYDPAMNTWAKVSDAPMEIHHFQAISYQNEIWVVGALTGGYPHETPIPNILIFNPKTKTWRDGPKLPENRVRGSAGVFVKNDKIYMVCGIQDGHWDGFVSWFDELDPKTGKWKALPDAPRARDHVSAALVEGNLYLAGGRTSNAKNNRVIDTTIKEVDLFDFEKGSWETLSTQLPTERAGNSNLGIGRFLVVMNGESGNQVPAHAEVEVLDTKNLTWTKLPNLNQGRHGTGNAFLDGKIYVQAGSANRGGGPEVSSMEVIEWKLK
ncbi:N-acetylneuraminic acid mutarotase [Algoriphagus boseongensis]|uniref:N-acetylneuraminic acid mutarotase n=1 Tax=Algoriphagus boseongensis TaxID=1442587 RepID=A0A4R6T847_9BACT|nr:kelch repeat-containing protein [Algoriphagus boseongensis]TDQ18379.1 N-acetylneuraminic acid mutarotase [Algoriphagus boseongensis]